LPYQQQLIAFAPVEGPVAAVTLLTNKCGPSSALTLELRGNDDETLGKEVLQSMLYEHHGYGQNEFVPWQLGAVM
jgi:hypothetical protein